MGVLKYGTVRYEGVGVDIQNTVNIPVPIREQEAPKPEEQPENQKPQKPVEEIKEEKPKGPSKEELLKKREDAIAMREAELEQLKGELAALKEQYIEQGKQVIVEAKRRADGIVEDAETQASEIRADAEQNREGVFIKARAEGYEQGKKDGVAMCLREGQGILDEARDFVESINEEKAELFVRYENEIYETVMEIANKVTLNSMSVKDGTAAKKLIKQAAKDFRNSKLIRITLDENGATTEFAGDYEFLKELCGSEKVEVELIADAQPGTVIVENGEEITDAGIMTQLKMIKELGDGKFRAAASKKPRKKKAETPKNIEKVIKDNPDTDFEEDIDENYESNIDLPTLEAKLHISRNSEE
ncbi:MAG: hypothetical protein K2J77_08500 [Oscillospiraceae bacterium]|nr:hypothetical protein [Oscillospiraceae bacterium]